MIGRNDYRRSRQAKIHQGSRVMKALISAAFAAAILLSGPALADEAKPTDQNQPVQLTAAQMDTVTAGAGLLVKNPNAPAAAGGIPPWIALLAAGFGAVEVDAGPSGIILLLPR